MTESILSKKEIHPKWGKQLLSLGTALSITVCLTSTVEAANWFKLRGTEPGGIAHTLQVWGFLQPTFVSDGSDEIDGISFGPQALNGTLPVAGTVPPDRKSQDTFTMRRARLGIRGTMVPINNDIDYFFLTEFGENGVTRGGGGSHLLDASITLNQLSGGLDDDGLQNLGARFRTGQFLFSQTSESLSHSTPGRRVHIFMPEATLAFALNRPANDNGAGNFPGAVSVNAARDIGLEIFDWAEFASDSGGPHEFTYSLGVGNGGTIGELNRDDNFRTYAWLSYAKLFDDTRGPRRHDFTVYGFYQEGDRLFNNDINDDGTPDDTQINPVTGLGTASGGTGLIKNGNEKDYNQKYYGIGVEYFDKPFAGAGQIRFEAEYQKQEGLIFDGAQSPSIDFNKGIRYVPDGESDGWYVDFGYDINGHLGWNKRTTINARWDNFRRNKDSASRAVEFNTFSLTGEYFFHKKARLTLTYQAREFDADDRSGNPEIIGNHILNDIDHRIGIQLTFIFKNVLLR